MLRTVIKLGKYKIRLQTQYNKTNYIGNLYVIILDLENNNNKYIFWNQ